MSSKAGTITVFTPTYNREHTLDGCYQSLVNQTDKDFIWLLIDDGSSDNTKDLVNRWVDEKKIRIDYHYKENGGLHSAYNHAYEKCTTNLIMCLDSDDDLGKSAVEKVRKLWDSNDTSGCAGIIANETYRESGEVIGTRFPEGLVKSTFFDVYYTHKILGDKMLVYQKEYIDKYPAPVFPGEKLFPPSNRYLNVEEPLLILNDDDLYYKEYLDDGYTRNILSTYAKNPNSYSIAYLERLRIFEKKKAPLKVRLKCATHYIACSMLVGKKGILKDANFVPTALASYLPGVVWFSYLNWYRKKNL